MKFNREYFVKNRGVHFNARLFSWFTSLTTLLFTIAFANTTFAEMPYQPKLEKRPNQTCEQCHKFASDGTQHGGQYHFGKFSGVHLSKANPNNGQPITCESCHGKISDNHRRGAKDVMRFQTTIFPQTPPMFSVAQQNQVCFACHQPDKMRDKLWAHDVHAMKIPCAACHQLHPQRDPMQALAPKQQVKLCVDCHAKQQLKQVSNATAKESSDD